MSSVRVTGPFIELTVRGLDHTRGIPLVGIVDTGASTICMDRRIALTLGLSPVNRTLMRMADGSEVVATSYRAELEIPALDYNSRVEIYAIPMERPSKQVLLGRSFLKRYRVNYDGPSELFHFYDASTGPVQNYLEEHDG